MWAGVSESNAITSKSMSLESLHFVVLR